jgi:hypothetical protein
MYFYIYICTNASFWQLRSCNQPTISSDIIYIELIHHMSSLSRSPYVGPGTWSSWRLEGRDWIGKTAEELEVQRTGDPRGWSVQEQATVATVPRIAPATNEAHTHFGVRGILSSARLLEGLLDLLARSAPALSCLLILCSVERQRQRHRASRGRDVSASRTRCSVAPAALSPCTLASSD